MKNRGEKLNIPIFHHSITPQIQFCLQIPRAFGEQLFDFRFLANQSLFVGKVDERFEHFSIALDAVRVGIFTENFLGHGEVFLAEEKRAWNAVHQLGVEVLFGFDKTGVEIERYPWIFPIDVAADRVRMVDWQEAPFLEKALAFGQAVGK